MLKASLMKSIGNQNIFQNEENLGNNSNNVKDNNMNQEKKKKQTKL